MESQGIKAIVVTPVKDAVENTLETIRAVRDSSVAVLHIVYNDFSLPETKATLEQKKEAFGYQLIHLEDLTNHPSPNYRLVLQDAQKQALEHRLPLILVESDVIVKPDTFERMLDFYQQHAHAGLIGAVTVDEEGHVNFPYLRFKDQSAEVDSLETKKSLSFCCTLLAPAFLQQYDFAQLNESKDWFDTFISYQATDMGFKNYLLYNVPVWHKPHGSRPWKQLKYTNPVKYYFLKFLKRRDKI